MGDHAAGDHRFAEAHLVRNEEAPRRLLVQPQSVVDVGDGGSLKVLQTQHLAPDVRTRVRLQLVNSSPRCAAHTALHRSFQPSGSSSSAFGS